MRCSKCYVRVERRTRTGMLGFIFYVLMFGQNAFSATPDIQHVVLVSVDGLRSTLTQSEEDAYRTFTDLWVTQGH